MEFNRNKEGVCPRCGKVKELKDFYPSLSDDISRLPLCSACATNIYKTTLTKTKSIGAALWSTCMQMGVPMMKDCWEELRAQVVDKAGVGKRPDMFKAYYNIAKEKKCILDLIDSDMQLSDFVEFENEQTEDIDVENCEGLKNVWGDSYTVEQYNRLDNLYNKYTKGKIDMPTAQILRYRDLCRYELKQLEGDDSKETMDAILKLMKLLGLDQFQDNKISETEKFIDRWLWRIENTKPAECEDLEKYKDYAGNESMWRDIARTLTNAVAGTREYPDLTKIK